MSSLKNPVTKSLVLVGLLFWTSPAKSFYELSSQVGGENVSDRNIADNWTGANANYFVPWGSLKLTRKLGKGLEIFLKERLRSENHVTQRSPTLNSSFSRTQLGMVWKIGKPYSLKPSLQHARSLDPKFQNVKDQYRIILGQLWKKSSWKISTNFTGEWENYGDNSQDGRTWLTDLNLEKRIFKKTLPKNWKLTPKISLRSESRTANSTSYTYWKRGAILRLKATAGAWRLATNLKTYVKNYQVEFINPQDGIQKHRRNEYLGAGADLSYRFGKFVRIGILMDSEKVSSNDAGYSYYDLMWKGYVSWTQKSVF